MNERHMSVLSSYILNEVMRSMDFKRRYEKLKERRWNQRTPDD